MLRACLAHMKCQRVRKGLDRQPTGSQHKVKNERQCRLDLHLIIALNLGQPFRNSKHCRINVESAEVCMELQQSLLRYL